MFVVNTVSQLQDALNWRAKEILVTGELAGPVQAACQQRSSKDKVALATEALGEEFLQDIDEILKMSGVPAWERDSMLSLIGKYTAIETVGNPTAPSVILKLIENLDETSE
jgi:hypothetical protein